MPTRHIVAALVLTLSCSVSQAQEKTIVLDGARIHSVSGPVIESGRLVVSKGKIVAVGKLDDVEIPAGSSVIDAKGKVIIPGLVDTHSHLGVASRPLEASNSDGNESTGPVQAVVRALDSVNVMDPGFQMALSGGLTTANIMPGSGNVIGGQTVYVKLRGRTIEEMQIKADGVLGGLKMANGENPKRYGTRNLAPKTRMKVAALQRTEFMKARDYMRKWQQYRSKLADGDKDATPPDTDLTMEPLVEVLQGKRTVHFHTHRADDILTVLRLKREFGFELVIQHGTEGYKVIREIAAAGVPVSMTIVDSPGGKAEVVDFIEACGLELTAAGVSIHVNTDDPVTESRFFLRTASAVVRGGLDSATALKAVTLNPAQAMHLGHRVGSLEVGKDADFVILSGEPFSIYTRVLQTWIEGEKLFDLEDDFQRLYQTGGFPLANRASVPKQEKLVEAPKPVSQATQPAKTKVATQDDKTFAIFAGRVHTVSEGTVENGVVFVADGKIAYVGPRGPFKLPPGVPVLTAAEVTPGLIDTHTAVPLAGEYNITADQDLDERTDPNQADLRALDAFNPSEPLLQFLLEQGVTIAHATPGHANVIAGQTGVFRTHGNSVEEMTVRFPHAMMFNLGAGPKETYPGKAPATRMGTSALVRNALQAAVNYNRKKEAAAKKDDGSPPDIDLKLEALSPVVRGELPAMFTAHRADDILTSIRLSREFQLKPVLALATEGYLIRDQLKAANISVIAHPPMQRVGGLETFNSFLGNAAALSDAGLPVAICSSVESYVPKTRVIRWEAAIGMVYGLGFDRALRSITLDAAKILHIDGQYGSLEAGKVADIVLYDGDPFENATHVTHVVSGGRLVFQRSKRRQRLLVLDRRQFSCPEAGCCAAF